MYVVTVEIYSIHCDSVGLYVVTVWRSDVYRVTLL
jgi:hypothetical protein